MCCGEVFVLCNVFVWGGSRCSLFLVILFIVFGDIVH